MAKARSRLRDCDVLIRCDQDRKLQVSQHKENITDYVAKAHHKQKVTVWLRQKQKTQNRTTKCHSDI